MTLKLKSADFKIRTRARSLGRADAARRAHLRRRRATCSRAKSARTRFRLIGIGVSHLEDADGDDLADLHRPPHGRSRARGRPVRAKFGRDAVVKGLALDEDWTTSPLDDPTIGECAQRRLHGFAVFISSDVISPVMVKSA